MRVNVTRNFRYAFEGIRVVDFVVGDQEVPNEVGELALHEGWAQVPRPAAVEDPAPAAPDAAAAVDGVAPTAPTAAVARAPAPRGARRGR